VSERRRPLPLGRAGRRGNKSDAAVVWASSADRSSGVWARDRSAARTATPNRMLDMLRPRVARRVSGTGGGTPDRGETFSSSTRVHATCAPWVLQAQRSSRDEFVRSSGHVRVNALHMDVKRLPAVLGAPGTRFTGDTAAQTTQNKIHPARARLLHAIRRCHSRLATASCRGREEAPTFTRSQRALAWSRHEIHCDGCDRRRWSYTNNAGDSASC